MKVNNVSENAEKFEYMVIRYVDGEAWYYGSWNDFEKAAACACEIGGAAIPTCMVIKGGSKS